MSAADPDRLTAPDRRSEDQDAALHPKPLGEFVGQEARCLEPPRKGLIGQPWAK